MASLQGLAVVRSVLLRSWSASTTSPTRSKAIETLNHRDGGCDILLGPGVFSKATASMRSYIYARSLPSGS